MKTLKKILALTLALLMLLPLVACDTDNNVESGETTSQESTSETTGTNPAPAVPDSQLEIKIYALNGTTSMGMAQMISNVKKEKADMNYNITLHTAADAITGAIVSGECAIAALPTNAAATLFNKSEGKIQLLALNTLGVLYLLQNGENITSLSDLEGKTVYVPGAGSNPEYIMAALAKSAGVNVTIDKTTYPSPDALQTALANGSAKLGVLPEPKVTVATSANENLKVALNLTTEWEKVNGANTLVQGCLVVNTEFAKKHPAEVKKFLEDYKASVDFIKEGSDDAINMIVDAGILPKAPVAKKALPKCNICFIAGEDMKTPMNTFCEKLFAYEPKAIGGKMPTDDFYYVAK